MAGLTIVTGKAAPLCRDNVDTDQLCAARFMKRRRKEGYGDAFLHDLRFDEDGAPRENVVDHPDHEGAVVLIAGRNFGGGSSREAAVYAVVDAGFKAVIASSFGEIFAANAVRNGLVPAAVEAASLAKLAEAVKADPTHHVTVDLEALEVRAANLAVPFHLDKTRRTMLLNGWDDADVTAQYREAIDTFLARDRKQRPYAHNPPSL
ncbi:MAG: 3-isopropylmalate dehydratase small subunit [Pseudomonadota bacterium]